MNTKITQTCVLYFTAGANSSKCFSYLKKKNVAIQQILFEKTLSEIRKTQLNYIVSNGKQCNGSFADKINAAITNVFDLGFKQIVLVGDDTPQLSAKQIKIAAQNLYLGKLSIGPSTDGGAYLIAFNQSQFDDGLLEDLAWQTLDFCKGLSEKIMLKKYGYESFSELSDLDNSIDIQNYLQNFSYLKFTQTLKSVFYRPIRLISTTFLIEQGHISSLAYRGPPLVA